MRMVPEDATVTRLTTWQIPNNKYYAPLAGEDEEDLEPKYITVIAAPYDEAFPMNEGWYLEGQTARKPDNSRRCLTDLTIQTSSVCCESLVVASESE